MKLLALNAQRLKRHLMKSREITQGKPITLADIHPEVHEKTIIETTLLDQQPEVQEIINSTPDPAQGAKYNSTQVNSTSHPYTSQISITGGINLLLNIAMESDTWTTKESTKLLTMLQAGGHLIPLSILPNINHTSGHHIPFKAVQGFRHPHHSTLEVEPQNLKGKH